MSASYCDRKLQNTVEPSLPPSRLSTIARELDRHAEAALKHGQFLLAEKASQRAQELRELALSDCAQR